MVPFIRIAGTVALPLQTLKAQNMTVNTTASSSKFQASNSNDDCGNNKKNSTPTLDIIEFVYSITRLYTILKMNLLDQEYNNDTRWITKKVNTYA